MELKKHMEIPGGWGGPPTTLWNGNSRGVEGSKLKNHPWGGGGGVWIFSGITQCPILFIYLFIYL